MKQNKYKIGIIHFDTIHIIPHFVGPVKAFYNDPDFEVEILTHQGPNDFLYESLAQQALPANLVKTLPTYWHRRIIEKIKKRKIPSPLYLFKKHKNKLLNDYDALIFNDINHEYLYQYRHKNSPKFVLLMHGAGDRDYLIGSAYKESVGKFDLVTTSGQKVTEFFKKMQLKNTKLEICGYQKFDLINPDDRPGFFNNSKPVVLYNPHFEAPISSWYRYGLDILDFFYRHKTFNLIFAPHINLFNKKGYLKPDSIPQKFYDAENILIDLGSKHSVNMDYTLSADVYLGDVSSQIYEFLYRLRPAIFINTHKENWQDDPHYSHWQTGEVIDNLSNLEPLLTTAYQWHKNYIDKQMELMQYTFKNTKKGEASENIKNAVKKLLTNQDI